MKNIKKPTTTVRRKARSSSEKTAETKTIPSETVKARVWEQWQQILKQLEEEYGTPCASCHQEGDDLQVLDNKYLGEIALKQLEDALARPAIGFEDSEILKRSDGIIGSPVIDSLSGAKRHRLLQCRENLAARTQELERPEAERMFVALAEGLLQAERTEAEIQNDARSSSNIARADQVLASLRQTKRKTYRLLHRLLDKLEKPAFCRCVETFWDYWVHGGPAEFLQDLNVYHMAKIHPQLKAEAERKGKPELIPSQEKCAKGMRRVYPGEGHLTEGVMNKSYGFVVPLPFLPRHIARYVTSDDRKQWYVTWMQWHLSYGATVHPKTEEWKRALEASYEPFVCNLMNKAGRRVFVKIRAPQRRELLGQIEKRLRAELHQAIDDFDFFYKEIAYIGREKFFLPAPPRSATVLTSNEIAFTAHINERLRGVLHRLIASDWQFDEPNYAQLVEIDGETYVSERMATAVLGVTRQSLFNWRKEGRISGVTWRTLSRSGKVKNLRGQKAPRSTWIFYSKSEIGRILAERRRPSPLSSSPDGEPKRPKGDVSREIAELFAESQQLPTKRKGEDRHVVLDEADPDG